VIEKICAPGIRGFEVGLLRPISPTAHEHVSRAGIRGAVVSLVTVHSRGVAVLRPRSNDNRIARHTHGGAERITCAGIRGFEVGLLAPGRAGTYEHIGRASTGGARIRRITVYSSGVARVKRRADHYSVARHRHRHTKAVIAGRPWRPEARLLTPAR